MDDNTLDTQLTDIAKCIHGLKVTLSGVGEADGAGDISNIVTDVHKLIESFRLLGKYYYSELLQKYQELESTKRELESTKRELEAAVSQKLQLIRPECNSGPSSVPRAD